MPAHLFFHLHNHHCQMNCYLSLCLNETSWLTHRISSFHDTSDVYIVFCPYGSSHRACHGNLLLLCTWCLLPLILRGIPLQMVNFATCMVLCTSGRTMLNIFWFIAPTAIELSLESHLAHLLTYGISGLFRCV